MKVLITGISSGIGKATSIYLLKKGYQVWGVARRKESLENLSHTLNSENFLYTACDIANGFEVQKLAKEMEAKKFIPQTVILNAAILIDNPFPDYNRLVFDQTLETNFHAQIHFINTFLHKFIERGGGHFIGLNTTSAFRANERSLDYSISKLALSLAFERLQQEFRRGKIFFSSIYLGPVATQMWEGKNSFFVTKDDRVAAYIEKIIGSPKNRSYYPPLSTFLFRIGRYLPDRFHSMARQWLLQ